jgi:hypothetical protein
VGAGFAALRAMTGAEEESIVQNKANLYGPGYLVALCPVGWGRGTAGPQDAVAHKPSPRRFYCQDRGGPLPCWDGRKVVDRASPLAGDGRAVLARTCRRAGTHDLQGALA